jgi:3-oxoacyl-[acyl-carrier-protein] synthase III
MSQIQLHADAALNAMADAGLKPSDIDGVATAGETPVTITHYLGITPKWVDGTADGVPRTARQGRPPGDRS